MSDIPKNCKVCGCVFNVPSAKISVEHCIIKELNTTAFLCVDCASKLIKWLQDNSIDIHSRNSNLEKTEEHGNKKSYQTVNVGGKIWMAENLDYDDGGNGIYYNQNNKEYYYTWEAVNRIAKKLDWKLPTDEDWNKACEECGGVKDVFNHYEKCSLKQKLKIKLSGYYLDDFFDVGSYGYFWSEPEGYSKYGWYRSFATDSSVYRECDTLMFGYSVRLIKDKE